VWLLVRDNAMTPAADGSVTLAACPDTADRGEDWRWRVWRGPPAAGSGGEVFVETDPDSVRATTSFVDAGPVTVSRRAGEEVVVVPLVGHHLVADSAGPWQRWLHPGDAFVLEGEESETVNLSSAPGPARVAIVRLNTLNDAPLRWVP
jgi:hypothetical protein